MERERHDGNNHRPAAVLTEPAGEQASQHPITGSARGQRQMPSAVHMHGRHSGEYLWQTKISVIVYIF
jgi:hypothetical protein